MAGGHRSGYTVAATSGSTFNVRSGTFAQQTTAAQRSIVSSSASDTSAAGTGARSVTITYLDSNMVRKTDTVSTSGTAVVPTNATDIQFVESMVVATTGSGATNAGTITMGTTAAGGSNDGADRGRHETGGVS